MSFAGLAWREAKGAASQAVEAHEHAREARQLAQRSVNAQIDERHIAAVLLGDVEREAWRADLCVKAAETAAATIRTLHKGAPAADKRAIRAAGHAALLAILGAQAAADDARAAAVRALEALRARSAVA